MWPQIILWVASLVISYAMRPKPPSAPPPATLDAFKSPRSDEGAALPVLFGTRDLDAPIVAWFGHLKTTAIRKKGGKK